MARVCRYYIAGHVLEKEREREGESILLRGYHVNKSCCEQYNPLCQVDRKSWYSSSGEEMMYMTEHLQPQSFYCGNSAC